MKFTEVATRITGISCPIFGVQWEPPTSDVAVARRVIVFLEDRRVLYNPSEVEVVDHCAESVLTMREFLTEILGAGGIGEELASELRIMRAASRRFVDSLGPRRTGVVVPDPYRFGLNDWELNQSLGQLRGEFAEPLARISVKYGIDVEEPLSSILPEPTD